MSSWSAKWFFFLVIGFLIFTVSGGYAAKWKAVFTAKAQGGTVANSPSTNAFSAALGGSSDTLQGALDPSLNPTGGGG